MTAEDIIDSIIKREGIKYTNISTDRGGPTKYGITQATLAEWKGHPVTPVEVEGLTEAEAREIYRNLYIAGPGFNKLAYEPLRALLVDSGVNHGVPKAIRMLQEVLGRDNDSRSIDDKVLPDGILGPKTLAAANASLSSSLYKRFLAERIRFYGRIITRNPPQAVFAAGWMNRVAEFVEM